MAQINGRQTSISADRFKYTRARSYATFVRAPDDDLACPAPSLLLPPHYSLVSTLSIVQYLISLLRPCQHMLRSILPRCVNLLFNCCPAIFIALQVVLPVHVFVDSPFVVHQYRPTHPPTINIVSLSNVNHGSLFDQPQPPSPPQIQSFCGLFGHSVSAFAGYIGHVVANIVVGMFDSGDAGSPIFDAVSLCFGA